MKRVLDATDTIKDSYARNYEGEILVVSLDYFKPEYKEAKFQLFKAEGGFGCYPDKMGTKIFGYFTDEDGCVRRTDVIGIATEECIAEWEKIYGKFGAENRRRIEEVTA